VEEVEADHGDSARPAGGGDLHALLQCGRRKKNAAGLGGPKGRIGRPAARPIGPKVEGKFISE
jgi:hypothetical protein